MTDKKKPAVKKDKKKRGYSEEIKKKIVDMAREGKTIPQIIKAMNGPKKGTIKRACDKAGVSVKK